MFITNADRCTEVIKMLRLMMETDVEDNFPYACFECSLALSYYKRWEDFIRNTGITQLQMERWSTSVETLFSDQLRRQHLNAALQFFEQLLKELSAEKLSRQGAQVNTRELQRGWDSERKSAIAVTLITTLGRWTGSQAGWQTGMKAVLDFVGNKQLAKILARHGADAPKLTRWIHNDLKKIPSTEWPRVHFCQQSIQEVMAYLAENTLVTKGVTFQKWIIAFQTSLDLLTSKQVESLLDKAKESAIAMVVWGKLDPDNPDHAAKIPTPETREVIGRLFAEALSQRGAK